MDTGSVYRAKSCQQLNDNDTLDTIAFHDNIAEGMNASQLRTSFLLLSDENEKGAN